MWSIELKWNECWVVLASGFASQDDAEYAIALWKRDNRCRGDPFRTVVMPAPRPKASVWEPADVL